MGLGKVLKEIIYVILPAKGREAHYKRKGLLKQTANSYTASKQNTQALQPHRAWSP